jgi:hypothetical protein
MHNNDADGDEWLEKLNVNGLVQVFHVEPEPQAVADRPFRFCIAHDCDAVRRLAPNAKLVLSSCTDVCSLSFNTGGIRSSRRHFRHFASMYLE